MAWAARRIGVSLLLVWVVATIVFVAIHLVRVTVGLRVSATDERQGLDLTTHGENAYN